MASLYREISSLSADIATHATENYKLNSDIVLIVKSFNKKKYDHSRTKSIQHDAKR